MPLLSEAELSGFPETPPEELVPEHVGRYLDMVALSGGGPPGVIGVDDAALIRDRTGFQVEFLRRGSIAERPYFTDRHEVLMVHRGHWRLAWDGGAATLAPGDTCAVPPGLERALIPTMSGETALFRIRATDDPAGPTRR